MKIYCERSEKKMTYQDWAEEYFSAAEKIYSCIEELKEREKNALPHELDVIRRKNCQMYDMYLECMHTGNKLKSRKGIFKEF